MSKAFLRPGFAFGGSCLPKDLRALQAAGRERGVKTPMLDAAVEANRLQLARAYDLVSQSGAQRIAMIGLSFKPDTDDLRESPLVTLAERLLKDGRSIRIYDPNVRLEATPSTLSSSLSSDIEAVCAEAEAVIIGHNNDAAQRAVALSGHSAVIIDLVRVRASEMNSERYQGICW